MRILAKILIVLGILALVAAGMVASRDIGAMKEHDASGEEMTEKRSELRETLHDLNLKYRGYQQSIPAIPDSIRKATGGEISQTLRNYGKRIRGLEGEERELTRLIGHEREVKEEVVARLKWWVGLIGGSGAVLMLLGAALLRFRS